MAGGNTGSSCGAYIDYEEMNEDDEVIRVHSEPFDRNYEEGNVVANLKETEYKEKKKRKIEKQVKEAEKSLDFLQGGI